MYHQITGWNLLISSHMMQRVCFQNFVQL